MADALAIVAAELPRFGQHGTVQWAPDEYQGDTLVVWRTDRDALVATLYGDDRYDYLARLIATEPHGEP